MAAPQIPNLSTLRGSRGGRAPRRGRAAGTEDERAANDKIVQGTDNDASVSRLSAVEVGYMVDPFAKSFVLSETDRWVRRFPIINRGRLQSAGVSSMWNTALNNVSGRYVC